MPDDVPAVPGRRESVTTAARAHLDRGDPAAHGICGGCGRTPDSKRGPHADACTWAALRAALAADEERREYIAGMTVDPTVPRMVPFDTFPAGSLTVHEPTRHSTHGAPEDDEADWLHLKLYDELVAERHKILRLEAEVERLSAGAPPAVSKPWSFDVEYIGGAQPTDYGTGVEHDGSWQWAIFDGPSEQDDVVLLGIAENEDPTPVLAALCAEHNRSAPPQVTPEQVVAAITEAYSEYDGRSTSVFQAQADAVMALLGAPAGEVLWEGPTRGPSWIAQAVGAVEDEVGQSRVEIYVPVPPGTQVVVTTREAEQ